jgi:putative PIN family toxin of toxin-antitoxin system
MTSGARGATGSSMISAVFDTNLLISAFLSRDNPGGVSNELLRFVIASGIDLFLSADILDEMTRTLRANDRAQRRYGYTSAEIGQYRADLMTLATIVDDPTPAPGAVPRDPDDDKIVACAVAASVQYIVSRDDDLLSLGRHGGIAIIAPENFIHIVRRDFGRLPGPVA